MNDRTKNIATVLIAVLLFGAFIILAEGIGGDDDDDRLEAIATTTTRVTLSRSTSTSQPPTTLAVSPTIAPFIPPTTFRTTVTTTRRTATTRRPTATTARPTGTTATTVPPGPTGRATEASDNTAAFTHNADGTTSESATPVSATPGPLVFKIATKVLSSTGTSAQVRFTVELVNESGRRITFQPDGLRVVLTLTPSSGAPFTIELDAHNDVKFFDHREQITASTTAPIDGHGNYHVTGTVEVDYGS